MSRAGYVPDLVVRKMLDFRQFLWLVRVKREERFVESVETFDQKVELD